MALVTTIGSASANSYVTQDEAETYFAARLNVSAWTTAEDNRDKALLQAARQLQNENWLGSRVDSTQAMAWPRVGVEKADSAGSDYGYGYGEQYLTTEIPQRVKDAQCELALWLLAANSQPGEANRRVTSWSADGVSATYDYQGTNRAMPSDVTALISPLTSDVRIRRG